MRVGFVPSAGTRHVDQHFGVPVTALILVTVLASSSLESGDQTAVG
jgi:hypothetical protein